MDLIAHGLWAGAGALGMQARARLSCAAMSAAVGLAVLPDLLHLLPHLAWVATGDGTLRSVRDYALALPGQEPPVPDWVALGSHHLHCIGHSAVIATLVSALAWAWRHRLWLPLLGWWSHILIDVPTHASDYYPVPVLYPLSDWAFDGWAWNTPAALLLNYVALALVWAVLLTRRRAPAPPSP